jgi:hypothetical protein
MKNKHIMYKQDWTYYICVCVCVCVCVRVCVWMCVCVGVFGVPYWVKPFIIVVNISIKLNVSN